MARLVNDMLALISWASSRDSAAGIHRRLVLVGHSLGGAIAIRVAADPRLSGMASLAGLVVVEMVEGSALASLELMHKAILAIPRQFETVDAAIQWSVGHGVIKNAESARISVPAQLKPVRHNSCFMWSNRVMAV